MAATVNLLAMHLRLSKKLQDSVTVETADGKKVTATQRDDYINRAIKEMQRNLYLKLGREGVRAVLQCEVTSTAVTWTAGAFALPADDIGLPIALGSATYTYTYSPNKEQLDRLNNPLYSYMWTISGGSIYGYENGAAATTGCTYYYIKKDEGVNNTTDVVVTATFYDLVVELALADILLDMAEITPQEWSQMKTNAYRGL